MAQASLGRLREAGGFATIHRNMAGLSTFDAFKTARPADARELSGAELSALHGVLLSILDDMVSVCRETGIRWFPGGGTLLGTLREKGFIPWDDDLDFNMERRDWPRFRDAFLARFPGKYEIQEPRLRRIPSSSSAGEEGLPRCGLARHGLAFPRIRLEGTSAPVREDLYSPWNSRGVFIDVFLLESTWDLAPLRLAHGGGSMVLGFLYSCRKHFAERRLLRGWGMSSPAFLAKRFLGAALAPLSVETWAGLWDAWNSACHNPVSRYATFPVGRRHFFGELALREGFAAGGEGEFAGRKVPVPKGAEAYMERLYGSGWRVPPPSELRERHPALEPFFVRPEDAPRSVRIAVASHKPSRMPRDAAYIPVFAGAAGKPSIPGFARDDEGDGGISARNASYCELTALWWLWKNVDAEVLGLVHYRRHFAGPLGTVAGTRDFLRLLEASGADAILPRPRNYFIETARSQYAHAHHAKDLDEARRAIAETQPGFLDAFDRTMASRKGHRFNMFAMRKPLFSEYCEWLFGLLTTLERRIDTTGYSAYDRRVLGFLAERLLDVWIAGRGVRYAEMPVLHLEGQHWPLKIARFLWRKAAGALRRRR